MSGEETGRVITRSDLRDESGKFTQHPRASIRRKLVECPELGGSVWVWGISTNDRLLADNYAGGAPSEKGHKNGDWTEALVAAALRESDEDDARPLYDVPGLDNGRLLQMGYGFVNRMLAESFTLDFGGDVAEAIEEEIENFTTAEETP